MRNDCILYIYPTSLFEHRFGNSTNAGLALKLGVLLVVLKVHVISWNLSRIV